MPKTPRDCGFEEVGDEVLKRVICIIEGHEKTGKTHLALSTPGDHAIFNTDIGLEGVVHKFARGRKIYKKKMLVPADQANAKKMWSVFRKDYSDLLQSKLVENLIFDTETELWELKRMMEFGRLSNVAHMYTSVNADYRKMIKEAYESKKNLIMTQRMKKVYAKEKGDKDAQFTGKYEAAGFTGAGYLIQLKLRTYRTESGGFGVKVIYSRHEPDLDGMELEDEMCDMKVILGMIFHT